MPLPDSWWQPRLGMHHSTLFYKRFTMAELAALRQPRQAMASAADQVQQECVQTRDRVLLLADRQLGLNSQQVWQCGSLLRA
jgi:hypothetical protein